MENPQPAVKFLLITGLIFLLAAFIIWLSGDRLNWLGKLPGDVKIIRENFTFYMPITTTLIISILISIIVFILRKI